jgi:hypothetical protein
MLAVIVTERRSYTETGSVIASRGMHHHRGRGRMIYMTLFAGGRRQPPLPAALTTRRPALIYRRASSPWAGIAETCSESSNQRAPRCKATIC